MNIQLERVLLLTTVLVAGALLIMFSISQGRHVPPATSYLPADELDPVYAREVYCAESPVRMIGDGERIAQWAKTNRVVCK